MGFALTGVGLMVLTAPTCQELTICSCLRDATRREVHVVVEGPTEILMKISTVDRVHWDSLKSVHAEGVEDAEKRDVTEEEEDQHAKEVHA